ncbi:hypothetical protein NLI96_g10846 [Meripilus lineatus]|uniref:Protein kinase domain-containing protein n=1 Tax=Meripilus lineatus TaxID=2056292 RepID=A0AAD5UT02_9APHY|nr:hypothetical protein NLI96_g10846 [Physisporinus lineatus]
MLIVVKRTSLQDLCPSPHFSHSESETPFVYVDHSNVSMACPLLPKGSRPNLKPIPIAKESGPWSMDLVVEDSPSVAHYERLDSEFQDHFVGLVPTDFFRELLPEATSTVPHLHSSLVGALAQFNPMGEEQLLYRILNKQTSPYLGEDFRLAANNSPGIPYYSEHPQHDGSALFQDNKDLTVSRDLETSELHFEVTASVFDDPFRDHNPLLRTRAARHFLKSGPDYAIRRGQLVAYATDACTRQHRQFYHSVLICHHRARIIRWDRSGALVTESFSCSDAEGIALLGDFLWRFTHAPPSARGWDPTALVASKEDESACAHNSALKEWYEEGSVAKLLVWDPEKEKFFELLVSRPVVSPLSMVGRCTRGFWALDKATGLVVFVKDTWRVFGMEAEGNIIQRLLDHKVRNIPELHSHGDVLDGNHGVQHTWTQRYVNDCGRNPKIIQYVHYRLVSKTVGHSLALALENSRQLLSVTRDAFEALSDAYNACGLMHRDISIDNIIIDRVTNKGVLIDWEMAYKIDRDIGARTPYRSGTWQFMAHELLRQPRTVHQPFHDMESIFWVIFYATIRWFTPPVGDVTAAEYISSLFDTSTIDRTTGQRKGGIDKLAELAGRTILRSFELPQMSVLGAWFQAIRPLLIAFAFDAHVGPPPTEEETFNTFAESFKTVFRNNSLESEPRIKRKVLTIESRDLNSTLPATRHTGSFPLQADNIPLATSLPAGPFLPKPDIPHFNYPYTAPFLANPLKRHHEADREEMISQGSGKRRQLSIDFEGESSGSQVQTHILGKSKDSTRLVHQTVPGLGLEPSERIEHHNHYTMGPLISRRDIGPYMEATHERALRT